MTFVAAIAGVPTRIALTTSGAWTIKGGLGADVNSAVVPASELARLGTTLYGVIGTIELWFTADPDIEGAEPDHALSNISIVDVTRNEVVMVAGAADPTAIDYTVSFADFRQGFAEPRGGRLLGGLVNPDPLPDSVDLVDCQQLASRCLDAMGVAGIPAATMTSTDPPRDLQWMGCHAATELGKLLQHTGHVFCPRSNGQVTIDRISSTDVPSPPVERLDVDVTSTVIDRRARAMVFLTSPTPITYTFDDTGGTLPPWEFVAQDPSDDFKWHRLTDIASLGGTTAAVVSAVKKGFPDVDVKYQKKLGDQVFKCIRLKPATVTPQHAPILRQVAYPDGRLDKPYILLNVAVQEKSSNAYVNRTIRLDAESVESADGVLTFKQRLGQVDAAERADFDPYFKAINEGSLKPTFSCEAWDNDAGTKLFGCYGFLVGEADIESLSEAESRGRLHGYWPDTAVHCCSDLREVRYNGKTSGDGNYAACRATARKYALALLQQLDRTRLMHVQGFWPVEISGRVSEVRYNVGDCRTEIVIDGWTVPASSGGGGRSGGAAAKAKVSAEPHGQTIDQPAKPIARTFKASAEASAEKRSAAGNTGVRPPATKVNPVAAERTGSRRVPVYATTAVDGRLNWWHGVTYSGKFKSDASGDFSSTDLGQVSGSVDCIICSSAPIPLHQEIIGDAGPVTDDGKLMVFVDPPHLFVVKVTKDGGTDGSKTAAASWTYTVKDAGDRTLATSLAPQRARPAGKMVAAPAGTYGLATYVNSSVVLLDVFGERPGTGGCYT